MAARNRERVGPVRGPRLDTGVSLQGMTSFSFHAEALGYILCLFRGCPPPSSFTAATGTSDRPHSLSLSIAAMGSPASSYLLNNIS